MNVENKILSVWDKNYQEAKAFFKKNGHFPKYNENRKIRQWALVFYNKYFSTQKDRVRKLKAIGFEGADKWELWEKHFAVAKDIYFKTGKAPNYKVAKETYRYFNLWIINSGKKHPDRLNRLAAIGFKITATDTIWDKHYRTASAFFEKHGRFPNHNDNVVIAQWARVWVSNHGKENPEKMEKLRKIGCNFTFE